MTKITKERLQEIRDHDTCVTLEESAEMARMLLAGMEQEPVGVINGAREPILYGEHVGIAIGTHLFAEPTPLTDAERQELQEYRKAASEPIAWLWSNRKHKSEVTLTCPEDDEKAEAALWSGWGVQALCVVPQGEHVSQPDKLPDGWVKCSERMPDPKSDFRVCVYTPTPHEDIRYRFVPASLFKSVCRDATHWQYMRPPAAPTTL